MKKLLLILCLLCPAAFAAPDSYDMISFSVNGRQEIDNDVAEATLSVRLEDQSARQLAVRINQALNQAVMRAKNHPGIEVKTNSQYTQPVYDKSNKQTGWRGQGSVALKSKDFVALSQLIGELQEAPLQFNGLRFFVSDEARTKAESALTLQTIRQFKATADMIAQQAFQTRGWRLVNLNVGGNSGGYIRGTVEHAPMASKASQDTMPLPMLEGGKSQVQITISGTIQLQAARH